MKYANNEKLSRPVSGKDAGRLFCFEKSPKKEIVHNLQQASCSQSEQDGGWDNVLLENGISGNTPGGREIEIIEGSFVRGVEPRAAADVAARFEELDAERRVHYAAVAAAGVLPDEAPFPQEREWRKIKEESLKLKEKVKLIIDN